MVVRCEGDDVSSNGELMIFLMLLCDDVSVVIVNGRRRRLVVF
jgi:hypothetical protein